MFSKKSTAVVITATHLTKKTNTHYRKAIGMIQCSVRSIWFNLYSKYYCLGFFSLVSSKQFN